METEEERRKHRCCFTGHRPEKLKQSESEIRSALEKEIRTAVADGFVVFISGMARGTDIWASEIVLRLRDEGVPIMLVCASPYEGFERGWKREWQERYRSIAEAADAVRYICPRYSPSCFQQRNEWMVDRSARVIAVYDGEPGGTQNTIGYSRKSGVDVRLCTHQTDKS